jgi:hypothetical protein
VVECPSIDVAGKKASRLSRNDPHNAQFSLVIWKNTVYVEIEQILVCIAAVRIMTKGA